MRWRTPKSISWPIYALTVGLVAVACSSSSALGPLLVQSAQGGVSALALDGTASPLLAETAGVQVRQPTWSPDGRLAVWTELEAAAMTTSIAMGDETNQRRIEVPTAPFYYSWSPASDRLAYLGNAPDGQGVALGMVDVAAGSASLVDGGAPYYFDWQPDGERLAIHVAGRVLAFLSIDGTRTEIPIATGRFQAPAFLPDGRLVVLTAGPPQALSVVDSAGEITNLAPVEGVSMFVPTADGDRIAYTDVSVEDGRGELREVSTSGGEPQVVDPGPVAGFVWNTAGTRLLYFTIDLEAQELIPNVWDGSEITRYPGFSPSATFITEYLPFWDQYSRSLTLWSPEGDAFVIPNASDRILVQRLEEDSPADVGAGVFATWRS